jgi:ABC-type transport system involved in multi-copper enzyme maturation permease subunit
MSSKVEVYQTLEVKENLPLALWWRQTFAIFRTEAKKNIFNRRVFLLYWLALCPAMLLSLFCFLPVPEKSLSNVNFFNIVFAQVYEALTLRITIFFGCSWLFINLFRGELVDKSLHYYFLTPVRREIIVLGKYLAGLLTSMFLFVSGTAISLFMIYIPRGYKAGIQHFFDGPGLNNALAYLGISALACVGYGAVCLLLGTTFRNPTIPTVFFFGWEQINFLLPPILKKLSVIYYLQSLTPIRLPVGPYAIIAEPASAWIAIPGMFFLTLLVLFLACLQVRKLEINYGND